MAGQSARVVLDFADAWNLAWERHELYAHRRGAASDNYCAHMSFYYDGRVWIAAYDEVGRVQYRQKFTRERYTRAIAFIEKRYLTDTDFVQWIDVGISEIIPSGERLIDGVWR